MNQHLVNSRTFELSASHPYSCPPGRKSCPPLHRPLRMSFQRRDRTRCPGLGIVQGPPRPLPLSVLGLHCEADQLLREWGIGGDARDRLSGRTFSSGADIRTGCETRGTWETSVSANLGHRGEQSLPSTKTSHIRGRRWHRQKRQLVWFVGRHGGGGGGSWCYRPRG